MMVRLVRKMFFAKVGRKLNKGRLLILLLSSFQQFQVSKRKFLTKSWVTSYKGTKKRTPTDGWEFFVCIYNVCFLVFEHIEEGSDAFEGWLLLIFDVETEFDFYLGCATQVGNVV